MNQGKQMLEGHMKTLNEAKAEVESKIEGAKA
jgi:hypothetical protein